MSNMVGTSVIESRQLACQPSPCHLPVFVFTTHCSFYITLLSAHLYSAGDTLHTAHRKLQNANCTLHIHAKQVFAHWTSCFDCTLYAMVADHILLIAQHSALQLFHCISKTAQIKKSKNYNFIIC